jgi:hypothetical protein
MMSLRTHSRRSATELRDALGGAPAASAELISAALDVMAARCALPDRVSRTQRIGALIDAQAWTDAALAIVDLDRSRAVRQITHEEGEWSCRIGSRWAVPDWLDGSALFLHPAPSLAILGALLESLAQREDQATAATSVPSSGSRRGHSIPAVACDNYA